MYTKSEVLFSDRLAPITNSLGFFEGDYFEVVGFFYSWLKRIKEDNMNLREIVLEQKKNINLENAIECLLPLKIGQATKYLFLQTIGNWVAFFDNNYRGTDGTIFSVLPEYTKKRAITIKISNYSEEKVNNKWTGAPGELCLTLYGIDSSGFCQPARHINLLHDLGKWEFSQFGEPLKFENTDQYSVKRKSNRFSFTILKNYLENLGLSPFDESFYLPKSKSEISIIATSYIYDNQIKSVTLEEARRMNNL